MEIKASVSQYEKNHSANYKGIKIFSTHGLHEKTFSIFESLNIDKNVNILILGAGQGAFDERLYDAGYHNITSLDIDISEYKSKGKVIQFNLNQDFSVFGKFDVIIATEIIEHLENSFAFLRNIKNSLKDGGLCIITTPNPKSNASRALFLTKGDLLYFQKQDLFAVGHINPIFSHIFSYYVDKLGLTLKTFGLTEMDVLKYKKKKSILFILKVIFIFILRYLLPKSDEKIISIYVLFNDKK